ncbi:MAG: abortive infection family protein [Candidatus Eremiobacteraeota bacterium]|nr:abortive infection family protein [Candidatus Eremiobacteraeota bacterium]
MDQRDARQLDRFGDALGALIEEVAASKVDFLVQAAESDGFFFADGVFRAAGPTASVFTVTRLEDFASIDNHARRLHLLANDSPKEAIGGANELVESLCRTVLRLLGEPLAKKATNPAETVRSTLDALGLLSIGSDDDKDGAGLVRLYLQQLAAFVVRLDGLQTVYDSEQGPDGTWKGLSTTHARLVVGTAVTFAGFVADTYVERKAMKAARPLSKKAGLQ